MKKIKLILLALTILSAKFYAQVPSYVPTTGLVGWWPFNGNANDASVNSINGINYGATLTTDRSGNSNSAYLFSGAQWIQCGYNPILNVGSGSFTLSCWATKTGGNTFQHFITRNEITAWPNATTSYALRYQGPGVGIYASGNATNSNGSIATSSLSNLSNWNHFIGVYNATTGIISVYVNGVLSITSPIAANPQSYNNNGGLFFGVEHPTVTLPSGPQFLSGKLDDIGIWNRALTQSEITALYTNTPPPTFSIQANGCPNVSYQPTNFTPNAGSTYQWTITPSAGAQNSTGLNTANPTFIFNSGGTYSITVQETNNGNISNSAPASISILNLTNITPSVDGSFLQVINGVNTFSICTGLSTTSALVYNENWGNPPNTTYSYTINNGAQTPITTSATVPITYGNNTFTLTATSGVCALTNTINIYAGANPYVALGASNSINLCPGSTVNFVIDPTQSAGVNNSPGTTYSLVFSDNLAATVNISNLVNDTIIPHQYNVTSCGMTYPGNLYPANTFYAQVIAQNACGITQSSYSPITVHNPPTANFTVSDSTICAGESITITNIGSTGSVVGMNAPYNCTSQGKFYWTISGGTSGVNYTLISGVLGIFNSIFNNPNGSTNTVGMGSNSLNIQFLTPGIYTITQHYYNSCGTKTFVRNIQVGGITAGANQSVCLGDSVTLTASGGSNYTWNGGIQNGVSFTPTSTQTYTVTGTATGGCPNTSSTTVTVNSIPSANAGIDSTITCFNNNVGVQIGIPPQIGYTYSWSPAIGLSNPNIANPIANPGQTTIYMLTATNSSGCSATDQVTVTVDVFTPFLNLSPNVTICQGSSATLTASTNLSGLTWWEGPQFLGNQNTITVTPNIVGQHTYNVTASSNCPGSGLFLASVTVTVNPTPIAFAGSDSTITCNQHINGYQIGWFPTAGNTYSWSPTIGLSNPNIANPIANPPVTTTYTLTVTNSSGCVATDQVTATVNTSTSVISVSPNITICQGSSATLIGNANPGGLYWVGSNQYWSQDTIVVTPNTPGSQIYTAFSTNGCSNNSVVVTVLPSPQINSVNDQFTCAGTPTMPINFSGTPGATYSWANSNTSIGLAPIGNGNIPTFIAQNNSPYTIMATIIVTPSLTTGNQTCVGTPEIFNILVEPVPIVYPVNNEVVCCQSSTSPIIFYSNVPANFSWFAVSSSPQLTGYPINGTGIIPSFTPVNNSSIAETITFSYTAIGAQGCYGPTSTFTITVLPCNISVDPVTNLEFCNPGNFNGITFTGNASSYNWTNNQPGSGIPIFGTGNIPSSTLTNNTQQVIVSHIIVTPTYTTNGLSCTGNGIDFFINVYPTPDVHAGTDQNICVGDLVTLTGSGAHTYVWNNGVDNGVPFAPSNSTSYVVTGTDVNGCVNSDTIQINVNTPSSSTVNINSCDSYTLNGQTYTSSGIYSQVITNATGCDSTITLDLTLNYSPITPIVTIQNEVNLSTSNNSGVTYQWIQCSDLTAIAGQINSSFNPTVNGLYAVVATNSCGSDTSDCADVSTIGFFDMKQYQILVYPNPNNGEFYIEIPSELLGQLLRIVDINGRLIKSIKVNKLVNSIDILDLARGSYWLQIDSQQPIQILKQ